MTAPIRFICLLASVALVTLALAWEPEPAMPAPVPTMTPARPAVTSRGGRSEVLAVRAMGRPTATATATPAPVALGLFKITGYSDSPANGTDGRGITRSGEPTRWGVVAVDPAVIPLHSRLAIEGWDGMVFTALDTGGGIRGRHVDLWLPADAMAIGWGAQLRNVWRVRE